MKNNRVEQEENWLKPYKKQQAFMLESVAGRQEKDVPGYVVIVYEMQPKK